MGKKKKNKLNRMLKQQHLQQLSSMAVLPVKLTTQVPATPMAQPKIAAAPVGAVAIDHHFSREIWHTVISLLIVAALLVAAVIVHRQANYFTEFGNWLYKSLRLT